jgi:cobalt-zinc-cadmium efflux system protein
VTGTHGPGRTAGARHQRRLAWTLALTGSFLLVEVAGGLWTGSLALLADAGHMLTDVGAIALSLFAVRLAQRPPSPLHTYGFLRVEILAALVTGLVLLVMAGAILLEAWHRLWAPPEVQGGIMLAVAVGGLAVNLAAMRLLHEGAAESLNLRGAYLEVLGDALASLAVIAAAVIIQTTGLGVADPIASGLIGLFIVPRTVGLIRQAVHVLMEGVPAHVDLREVERALAGVPGVKAVHDLHVWTLTSGRDAMSAHVVVTDAAPADGVTRALHEVVHERFGIDHATIQLEPALAWPADQERTSPQAGDRICGASSCAGAPAAERSE